MSIIFILVSLLNIYTFLILARVLLTWIPNLDYYNPIVRFLFQVTEPVLRPIREAMPPRSGMDFSPMIVLVVLYILRRVIIGL